VDPKKLTAEFISRYGMANDPARTYFAPGRVNLIGEHIDYNGGFVLPCALTLGTYLVAARTPDDAVHLASVNFGGAADIPLADIRKKYEKQWVNYPLGVMNEFIKKGVSMAGMQLLFAGNIPDGAGLSSSAAIELVTALALNDLFEGGFDMIELVHMAQRAENHFVGVNCGIMDQFIVGNGIKDHALFLSCDDLTYDHIPMQLGPYKIVIANTNKKRTLADSKYNERHDECRKALSIVNRVRHIEHLCQLAPDDLAGIRNRFPDPTLYKRARHVITENERVQACADALKKGDAVTVGKLMNQSHDSLRDDYDVTGLHLDILVDAAGEVEGVLGARMTGAGFGGCSVNLVHEAHVDGFCESVGRAYEGKTGVKADFYVVDIGDGVKRIS